MTINLSPTQILAGLAVLIAMVWAWRASTRRVRRLARTARHSVHLVSLAGRVLVTAAVFAGVQWVVLAHPGSAVVTGVVLGLPDLLAGYALATTLTVTAVDGRLHRGRDHR